MFVECVCAKLSCPEWDIQEYKLTVAGERGVGDSSFAAATPDPARGMAFCSRKIYSVTQLYIFGRKVTVGHSNEDSNAYLVLALINLEVYHTSTSMGF